MKTVLITCVERECAQDIATELAHSYQVETDIGDGPVHALLRQSPPDIMLVDVRRLLTAATEPHSMASWAQVMADMLHLAPHTEFILLSPPDYIRQTVYLLKAGASNYLTYPIDRAEVSYVMEQTLSNMHMRLELAYLRDAFWHRDSLPIVRTRSPAMQQVWERVRSVAPTKTTVLLTGETGTGKGVVARQLHQHSSREGKPFVSVHCGAIPDSLLESELFGHEKGAFTGAVRTKRGKFEIAIGGTLFLDEIGTITPQMQIKLLDVLQEKQFQRVGGESTIPADVRIIAATNEDLNRRRLEGSFRGDLYFRLNIFPVALPPLRERIGDIELLCAGFLHKLNSIYGKNITGIQPSVLAAFAEYEWPGNIRELENLMERAYVLAGSGMLEPRHFPKELFAPGGHMQAEAPPDMSMSLAGVRRLAADAAEKNYVQQVLARHTGRIARSARHIGISDRQLRSLMRKHGLNKQDFK